jgi:hypothetical protein
VAEEHLMYNPEIEFHIRLLLSTRIIAQKMLGHDLNSGSSIVVKYSMSNPETEGSNPVYTLQREIGEDKNI